MRKILIVGATSAIAEATARLWAAQGHTLHLAARSTERLDAVARNLRSLGAAAVGSQGFNADDAGQCKTLVDDARKAMGGLDIVLIAHGNLPDQAGIADDVDAVLASLQTNALSVIALCAAAGAHFDAQGSGTLAVIGSVAGDRGRQSNYIYGTAKGAVALFLQGLRNRLSRRGVQVLTIKPGFVDTPMTASFKKGALWAKPEQIARGIVSAIDHGRDVVYLPGFWRPIMWIIRSIPERIFKRLSL